MERIGSDVERELGRFDGAGAMPRIVAAWPTAVGGEVARNAWPARVARDGTLHVNTSSSVWAFELGHLAPRILERLVAELGAQAPKALRFAQGHLPEPAAETTPKAVRTSVEPDPEALAAAASLTASIDDEELRKTVERAAALGLSPGRSTAAVNRPI
jgi:hypothetical protein